MYRCDDQRHFGEDASYNSTFDGVLVSNGNIKSILIGNDGDIFPMEIGGSHNIDYYCDMYKFMSNIKCVVLSGCGYDGGKAGVGYISVGTSSDYKTVASRLCYCKQP